MPGSQSQEDWAIIAKVIEDNELIQSIDNAQGHSHGVGQVRNHQGMDNDNLPEGWVVAHAQVTADGESTLQEIIVPGAKFTPQAVVIQHNPSPGVAFELEGADGFIETINEYAAQFQDNMNELAQNLGQAFEPIATSLAGAVSGVVGAMHDGVAKAAIEAAKAQVRHEDRMRALGLLAGYNEQKVKEIIHNGAASGIDQERLEALLESDIDKSSPTIKLMATQLWSDELAEDSVVDLNSFMTQVFDGVFDGVEGRVAGQQRAYLLRQLAWAVEDDNQDLANTIKAKLGLSE